MLAAADGGQRGSGCGSSTVAILFRGLEMAPSPGASLALGWKVLGTDGDSGPAFSRGGGCEGNVWGHGTFHRLEVVEAKRERKKEKGGCEKWLVFRCLWLDYRERI